MLLFWAGRDRSAADASRYADGRHPPPGTLLGRRNDDRQPAAGLGTPLGPCGASRAARAGHIGRRNNGPVRAQANVLVGAGGIFGLHGADPWVWRALRRGGGPQSDRHDWRRNIERSGGLVGNAHRPARHGWWLVGPRPPRNRVRWYGRDRNSRHAANPKRELL